MPGPREARVRDHSSNGEPHTAHHAVSEPASSHHSGSRRPQGRNAQHDIEGSCYAPRDDAGRAASASFRLIRGRSRQRRAQRRNPLIPDKPRIPFPRTSTTRLRSAWASPSAPVSASSPAPSSEPSPVMSASRSPSAPPSARRWGLSSPCRSGARTQGSDNQIPKIHDHRAGPVGHRHLAFGWVEVSVTVTKARLSSFRKPSWFRSPARTGSGSPKGVCRTREKTVAPSVPSPSAATECVVQLPSGSSVQDSLRAAGPGEALRGRPVRGGLLDRLGDRDCAALSKSGRQRAASRRRNRRRERLVPLSTSPCRAEQGATCGRRYFRWRAC